MQTKKFIALIFCTFFLVILGLPNLGWQITLDKSFNLNYSMLNSAVFAQEGISQQRGVGQPEKNVSLEKPETLKEALEIIENELATSDHQYNSALSSLQSGDFQVAEDSLKNIIAKLVNPEFQRLFEDDECSGAPGLLGDICRGAPSVIDILGNSIIEPAIRFTEQLLFNESSFEYEDINDDKLQAKLIESAEKAHITAVKSIRLLQKVIISQNFTHSRIGEALGVAELGRELEFVRLKPLFSSQDITRVEPPEGMSLDKIRDTVKDWGVTAVYFSVISPEEIFIWVIPPNEDLDITFRAVNLRKQFNSSIKELTSNALRVASSYIDRGSDTGQVVAWRGNLRSLEPVLENHTASESELQSKLHVLYQALIEPIEDYLPQEYGSPVIFIPQGELFSVPFAALQKKPSEYLVDQYAIRLSPDLRTLRNSRNSFRKIPKKQEILLVGNPEMPSIQLTANSSPQQLRSLPGAGEEIQKLSQLFDVEALTGEAATEVTISGIATSSKLIHLATHGILDDENSLSIDVSNEIQQAYGLKQAEYLDELATKLLPGAIALTPSSEQDGFLTSQEIIGLDLHDAELVVLSACNTARGVIGESSILGLPFALGTAGASRAMVTLWPVPDEPTRDLMVNFYSQLKTLADNDKSLDPAVALRDAMRFMKEKIEYRDPVNWAAFTLLEVEQ